MGTVCGILAVAVLAGGVVLVNNYSKMQQMESILASVLPAGTESWDEYRKEQSEDLEFIIEEIKGSIRPTEAEHNINVSETETMEPGQREDAQSETEIEIEIETGIEMSHMGASLEQNNDRSDSEAKTKTDASANTPETTQPLIGIGKESGQGDAASSITFPVDYKAAAANGYRIYEVGRGETLYGICWKVYGTLEHLTEICRLNNLTDVDRILAGQKLILP